MERGAQNWRAAPKNGERDENATAPSFPRMLPKEPRIRSEGLTSDWALCNSSQALINLDLGKNICFDFSDVHQLQLNRVTELFYSGMAFFEDFEQRKKGQVYFL